MSACRRIVGRAAALALFALVTHAPYASATSIAWRTWEEIVRDSDFVGIVECQVAGGLVAKFKVIESWKGKPAQEEVFLRMAKNYWGPVFPIALCGERSIVMAGKITHPRPVPRFSEGNSVPLWWRDQPADYQLPLFQGVQPLTSDTTVFFDSPYKDLAAFRQAVMEMAEPGSDREEASVFRGLCDMKIFHARERRIMDDDLRYYPPALSGEPARLRVAMAKARSATEIVAALLAYARQGSSQKDEVEEVLREGGGAVTLDLLEKLADDDPAMSEKTRKAVIHHIRDRLHPTPTQAPAVDGRVPPTEEQMRSLRTILSQGTDAEDFFKTFEVLTEHDPAFVAQYLMNYAMEPKEIRQPPLDYYLGSYFGWKCSRDRPKHLTALLKARAPYVRVAAAVYLMFEDEKAATTHLRAFTRLEGDPGVWAALTLARRGDKEVMPRALKVFDTTGEIDRNGQPHDTLIQRLRVLLSNSCQASGLPMPELKYGPDASERFQMSNAAYRFAYVDWWEGRRKRREAHEANLKWWDANKGKIILRDPWLPEFTKQKID